MDWFTPDCSFKAQRVFVQKDVLLWGQSLGAWGTGEAQRGPAAWEHRFLEGRNKTRLGLASHGKNKMAAFGDIEKRCYVQAGIHDFNPTHGTTMCNSATIFLCQKTL